MTIGMLSKRTGVPVKTLRRYEGLGLIYTVGRTGGNYRLFGDEALWCVSVVGVLRELGLTLSEITELSALHQHSDAPLGPRFAQLLDEVRRRTNQRIGDLAQRLERIDDFERTNAAELAGRADFRARDPRHRTSA